MSRGSAGGERLLGAFAASVAHLEAHVDALNASNVFPVPDGDTGSNMIATVRAALAAAHAVPAHERSLERIAGAIGSGALMGARGNSGVILSQVFQGMAAGLAGGPRDRWGGRDLADALERGRDAAYGAIGTPVEGTILTVLTDAAAGARRAAAQRPDLETALRAAVDAAAGAVARTPDLLPVLRDAGVVDAGGHGLYLMLQGAWLHLTGASPATTSGRAGALGQAGPAAAPPVSRPAIAGGHVNDGSGYETMFLISARDRLLDAGAIRADLASIGESVVVAGDAHAVKVHVHSDRPDRVIGYGLSLGSLSAVSVEVLGSPAGTPTQVGSKGTGAAPAVSVVAVAAGTGIVRVFEGFGVDRIVPGGPGAPPSADDLRAAIESAPAMDVVVLPNDPSLIAVAEAAATSTAGKRAVVVPTRNAAEGFAVLLARAAGPDGTPDRDLMIRAARTVRTLRVTHATRDLTIGTHRVAAGQTVALDADGGFVAADDDRLQAVLAAVAGLAPGHELVTLYHGQGADEGEARHLAGLIAAAAPGVEVEVEHGGQPDHSYLISAE